MTSDYLLQHQVLFLQLDPTDHLEDEVKGLPRLLKAAASDHGEKLDSTDRALRERGRGCANCGEVVYEALGPGKGDVLEHLDGGGGKSGLGETLAQLGDRGFEENRVVLRDQAEEGEKSKRLRIGAVWKNRDESHDVLLDQLAVHRVDGGQHPAQAVVA